jgi:hypothetical protein
MGSRFAGPTLEDSPVTPILYPPSGERVTLLLHRPSKEALSPLCGERVG